MVVLVEGPRQQRLPHQEPLALQQVMQVLVERPATAGERSNRKMDMDRPVLADAQRPSGASIFDSRVPSSGQMDDMAGACQRKADTARARRKDHRVEPFGRRPKAVDALLAAVAGDLATDDRGRRGQPVAPLDDAGDCAGRWIEGSVRRDGACLREKIRSGAELWYDKSECKLNLRDINHIVC